MAGRPKSKSIDSPLKGKPMAKHGAGKEWQFRFPKTEETEALNELFRCTGREDLEARYGIKIDEDLEWGYAMRDIVKNILVTIARGRLKTREEERKGGSSNEAKNKKTDLSSDNSLRL
jgi:hypothetical protein